MSDLKDIWSEGPGKGKPLSEEQLMAYLEGRLSPEEQHEVEAWMDVEGMEADALEGLRELPAEETRRISSRLRHELRRQVVSGKRVKRRPFNDNKWAWIAVVSILLLVILAYLVVHLSVKK